MGRFKEFSKCCNKCGVEWLEDWSNKYPKRAMCVDCHKIYYAERKLAYNEKHKNEVRKVDLMQPFKVENRQAHWTKINKELRALNKLEDIRAFIKKQADEIFSNKELMEFINHQSLK